MTDKPETALQRAAMRWRFAAVVWYRPPRIGSSSWESATEWLGRASWHPNMSIFESAEKVAMLCRLGRLTRVDQ